jgi:hypothetical protein
MILRIRRPLEPRARRSDLSPGARTSLWPHTHTAVTEDRTVAVSLSRLEQVPGGYTNAVPRSVQRLKNPYFLFFSILGYLLEIQRKTFPYGLCFPLSLSILDRSVLIGLLSGMPREVSLQRSTWQVARASLHLFKTDGGNEGDKISVRG